jgi:beta-N-acetylhexosaminidase
MIAGYHVGGLVLFAIAGNIESPGQVARLIQTAQETAVQHGAGIPLFVSLDQEGGPVVRLTEGATVFPSQMAISSPDLVAELGAAMIESYAQNGIIATAKHFPGHGDTAVDSHVGLPVVRHDRGHLERVEFPPFRAAIAAGVPAIMTAHVLFPAPRHPVAPRLTRAAAPGDGL